MLYFPIPVIPCGLSKNNLGPLNAQLRLGRLWEPPGEDPHAGWCGGWGRKSPGYPLGPLFFHGWFLCQGLPPFARIKYATEGPPRGMFSGSDCLKRSFPWQNGHSKLKKLFQTGNSCVDLTTWLGPTPPSLSAWRPEADFANLRFLLQLTPSFIYIPSVL